MSDMSSPDTRQPALTSEGELPSSAPSSGNKGREVHPLRTKQGGQYAGLHRWENPGGQGGIFFSSTGLFVYSNIV